MKKTPLGKTYKTKLGRVTVHLGRTFSLVSFPVVKWSGKGIPAEWRN